jgi:hypothetical protein
MGRLHSVTEILILTINGSLGGTFWLFGWSLGTNLGINYSRRTGLLSVSPSLTIDFTFLKITVSTTFNLGLLKLDPPIYIAGNTDDTFRASCIGVCRHRRAPSVLT